MASGSDEIDIGIAGLGAASTIGEGGNAVVYRCRQESLDREVAVKLLKRSSDEDTVRRFAREQRAMGRMSQHDGIVTVYESGITDAGRPYLVMPLLPGSLDDELKDRGAIPWAEAVDLIAEVSETVDSAHREGLVHRDLKPANIMRGMTGRPLVADFGISRIVDAGVSMQSTALTLTPAFSPPESLSGVGAAPTADVYSLGATLYALIEGHAPFIDESTSTNFLALLRRIADDPVPSLTADVPPWVDELLVDAMAKDPDQRIATAGELASRLRAGAPRARGAGRSAAEPPANSPPAASAPPVPAQPPPPPAPQPATTWAAAPPPRSFTSPAPGRNGRQNMLIAAAVAALSVLVIGLVALVAINADDSGSGPPATLAPEPTTPPDNPTTIPTSAPTSAPSTPPITTSSSFFGDIPEIANLPAGGQGYADFVDLTDEQGLITLAVPSAWSDVDTSQWDYNGDLIGPAISASPDLVAYGEAWGTPGLFIAASDQLQFASTGEFLDTFPFFDACDYEGRRTYDDGLYFGVFDVFVQCGPENSAYLQVAAAPADGSYLIQAEFLAVTQIDWDAIQVAVESFLVDVAVG